MCSSLVGVVFEETPPTQSSAHESRLHRLNVAQLPRAIVTTSEASATWATRRVCTIRARNFPTLSNIVVSVLKDCFGLCLI